MEVKEKLAKAINAFLEPIREKTRVLPAHPTIPRDVPPTESAVCKPKPKTMELVREKTGLSYSLDLLADELDIFGNED